MSRVIITLAAIALAGCGRVDENEQDAVDPTGEAEQGVSSTGKFCHGTCANGHVNACLPSVSSDCRAHIVNWCHSHGYNFTDAYWSYWGCG
jgi:hypothetical protein